MHHDNCRQIETTCRVCGADKPSDGPCVSAVCTDCGHKIRQLELFNYNRYFEMLGHADTASGPITVDTNVAGDIFVDQKRDPDDWPPIHRVILTQSQVCEVYEYAQSLIRPPSE